MSHIELYTPKHDIFEAGQVQATYKPTTTFGKVLSSLDTYNMIKENWPNIDFEERFYVIMLNRSNEMYGIYLLSIGSVSGTVADPKKIFAVALAANASAIILCHNHPSGSSTPSMNDNVVTRKCVESGKFLELPVLDHVIVCSKNYYSYADEGTL